MKTLDQRRAAHAWNTIESIRADGNRKDVVRAAKKLPLRIMTAGLGHSLAFVNAKDKAPKLMEALSEWVLVERAAGAKATQPAPPSGGKPSLPLLRGQAAAAAKSDLLQAIVQGTSDTLRRHSAEALAWLAWLNRFAEAEFKDDVKGEY